MGNLYCSCYWINWDRQVVHYLRILNGGILLYITADIVFFSEDIILFIRAIKINSAGLNCSCYALFSTKLWYFYVIKVIYAHSHDINNITCNKRHVNLVLLINNSIYMRFKVPTLMNMKITVFSYGSMVWQKDTDVSKELAASIFWAEE